MAWKGIVGQAFTVDAFDDYVQKLEWKAWKPSFIVVHNTAVPSLAQRPDGFLKAHMRNLETYYRDNRGWSAGPHLFIDDRVIWVFTPLTTPGVHSPSWNSVSIGIEMLGDYSKESFTSGRGLAVRQNTVRAVAALSLKHGFRPDSWKFHIEDKKSNHACPGKGARDERAKLIAEIASAMSNKKPDKPWSVITSEFPKK